MDDRRHGEATQAMPSMTPQLKVTEGDSVGDSFNLKSNNRIGRERDNDIVIIDPKMSRYHAQLEQKEGQWILTDLGSANKTYLNGEAINTPTPLKAGDQISMGQTEFSFVSGSPTPAPTVPKAPIKPSPTPTSSSSLPRLVWVAGGFIILLCMAGALVMFLIGRTTFEVIEEDGSMPNFVSPVGDQARSDDDDETSENNDIIPTPTPPANLELIYQDDFSDSFGGWDDAFDTYTTKQYGNNRYQIEVSTSNLIAWGLANRDVADFEIEVEAIQEGGDEKNSYGLLFRFQDAENYYRFDVTNEGFYLLSKFVDGEWETLIDDWTPSDHIQSGTNILKVSAFGPDITVWINDQPLTSITDDAFGHGNFGFFTSTFSNDYMWASFDNLKLYVPEGQEITLIPTATQPVIMPTDTPAPTPSLTLTPVSDTLPGDSQATEESEEAEEPTPTRTRRPTPEPTDTPEPLPEYAARDLVLARGEARVSGRIIYPLYNAEEETYDIYIADAADGENRELVQANASQPALNQDGTQLAYRSWKSDNRGLFARFLGSEEEDWKFDPFFESARPQFSPLDDSLIYHSRTGGREPAIYKVVDGTGQVMRRDGSPVQGKAPKVGPEGQQFAYNGCIGGTCGVMLSGIDGSNPRLLTDQPFDTNPEISPDGTTIVFMSNRNEDWEIFRVDIDGENLTALTEDDASDGLPTWSPDGSKIAFVANRDGEWAMWDMDPDGTNQRRLFVLEGTVDGIVQHDQTNSFGWSEENIDWAP